MIPNKEMNKYYLIALVTLYMWRNYGLMKWLPCFCPHFPLQRTPGLESHRLRLAELTWPPPLPCATARGPSHAWGRAAGRQLCDLPQAFKPGFSRLWNGTGSCITESRGLNEIMCVESRHWHQTTAEISPLPCCLCYLGWTSTFLGRGTQFHPWWGIFVLVFCGFFVCWFSPRIYQSCAQ